MPSTYSPLLRLELMAVGEKTNTWGGITNTNLGTLLEKSIAGITTVDVTATNVTLTALSGLDDQARSAILRITGTPGTTRSIIAPSISKTYAVFNSSNAVTVIKGAATTGVSLLAGEYAMVVWNGSDFIRVGVSPVSPVFTGTPTAPTAAVDANTTQLATTSFVINQGYAKTAAVAAAYAPLGGAGTSGTWPISITGNSVTSGEATKLYGYAQLSDVNAAPSLNVSDVYFQPYNGAAANKPVTLDNANGLLTLVSHPTGGSGSFGKQLAFADDADMYMRRFTNGAFDSWSKILHSDNYFDYAPTRAGAGAYGTWSISITGSAGTASSATKVSSQGQYAAGTPGTTRGPSGLNFLEAYNNGYPTDYGNVLHAFGNGAGQLLIGWSGSDGAHAENFIRSKRDNDTGAWSPWATLVTSVNYNSYAPTLTGANASGTWAINVTGTADHTTNSAYNGYGARTVSTSAPSGGSDGDVWYQY